MKMPELAATKAVLATLIATIALLTVAGVAGALTVGGSSSSSRSASKPATGPKASGTETNGRAATPAATGKRPAITDVCTLVTPTEASAAFGGDAGPAHLVLNACLYDNGTHKLIVALTHESAQSQFDAGHGKAAKDVADVGDRAYVQDGRLRVLKGSYLMMLTLDPADQSSANAALVTLGKAAAPRL